MKYKSYILLALALVAALAIYLLYFNDSDERAVRKRLEAIIANVEKPVGEGNISMVAKHQSLSGMVADHIHAECTRPSVTVDGTSDTVLSTYATARHYAKSISLAASNVKVTFPEKDTAVLTCYGTAKITSVSGERFDESRPVVLTFHRKENSWLLADAREHTVFK